MRPEIEAYLRDHGARYTTQSLRRQLIAAGYDATETDAALEQTEGVRRPQLAETRASRSRFWRVAIGLHIVALALVIAWVFTRNYTYAPIAAIFLAVMLLVGLGISGLIGRSFLPQNGLALALIVPVISAVGLSGICLATMRGSPIQIPPRPGVMELQIDPPLSFDGSGVAQCYLSAGGFSVYGPDLGTLDGRFVTASLSWVGDSSAQASAAGPSRTVSLSVGLIPRVGTEGETLYGTGDPTFELDAASNGLSGTVSFEGLGGELIEPLASGEAGPGPISGTIHWTCE